MLNPVRLTGEPSEFVVGGLQDSTALPVPPVKPLVAVESVLPLPQPVKVASRNARGSKPRKRARFHLAVRGL
jgi:hypothetical protein